MDTRPAEAGTTQTTAVVPLALVVAQPGDVTVVKRRAKEIASDLGFAAGPCEELALVACELASNLLKHAGRGILRLVPLEVEERVGLHMEAEDRGPGIADVELAMTDGFSTAGSLGGGLGLVNRLMDHLDITSISGQGTSIRCERWVRSAARSAGLSPLDLGVATRVYPGMEMNGDAFVLRQWDGHALVAVIDGLGHGQFAHRAAQAARRYVESHYDQPLAEVFRGVGRACRATRGVVMAMARFAVGPPGAPMRLSFASVGNVEARVYGSPEPINFVGRRGVLGGHAPSPAVLEQRWEPTAVLVLHSDGVSSRWQWEDLSPLLSQSASVLAQGLLRAWGKKDDDATVVVVKGVQT